MQHLNYTASEVHAAIGGLFAPDHTDETRAFFVKRANAKLAFLEQNVLNNGKKFLVADKFSVADSYLYIALSWTAYVNIDLTPYPNVKQYYENIANLDFVKEAHALIATSPATTC